MSENTNPTMLASLEKDLQEQAKREHDTYQSIFPEGQNPDEEDGPVILTKDEWERINQMEEKPVTTVTTEDADTGAKSVQSIEDYAKPLDGDVVSLLNTHTGEMETLKLMNNGDIKKTAMTISDEAKQGALQAFRDLAIASDHEYTDDEIIAINSAAMEAVKKDLHLDKLDADVITRKYARLPLARLAQIIPKEFCDFYISPDDIKRNSLKAKERLLTALAYTSATGPELDYLNDYIEKEHRRVMVSSQLMQCQVDFSKMLRDEKTVSQIAAEAAKISAPDTSIWSKYIANDPKRLHNEFAQNAVIFAKYKEAYQKLRKDYENDPDSLSIIDKEIAECDSKYEIYTTIANLTDLKSLWATLCARLLEDKRCDYVNLVREAKAALKRINDAKQEVPFPVYARNALESAKGEKQKLDKMFDMYMGQFPSIIDRYNSTIAKIQNEDETARESTDVHQLTLPNIDNMVLYHYLSLLLLILFGRVMKKFSNGSKYDAIKLDAYFKIYCMLFSDIYLITDLWDTMKDGVEKLYYKCPMNNG